MNSARGRLPSTGRPNETGTAGFEPLEGRRLLNGRRIARNSFLNLTSGGVAQLAGIVIVPLMLHSFGAELYGVLSVTWLVLAQLSWLDFGFSRASAKYVAEDLEMGLLDRATIWCWTALATQAGIGLCGAVLLWLLAPTLTNALHVSIGDRGLVIFTLQLFAFSLPLDLAARSLSGVAQAGQRFGAISALNIGSTIWTYAVYALAIVRGGDFHTVIIGLFALRFANLAGYYWIATRVLPAVASPPHFSTFTGSYYAHALKLIKFGGWVTMSALIGPFLLYFDQWIIGALLGVAILPYYTVPFNLLTRLSLLPSSLTTTLFPAFSAMRARAEWKSIEDFFFRSNRYLLIVVVPLLFICFFWASEVLRLWLGARFAHRAVVPLQILVPGFFLSLLAPLSGALLEGTGRPDLLAKVYLVELPFNLASVWLLTKAFGLTGAAVSYSLRAIVETLALWVLLPRVTPISWRSDSGRLFLHAGLFMLPLVLLPFVLPSASISNYSSVCATLLSLAGYALMVTLFLVNENDRSLLAGLIRRM